MGDDSFKRGDDSFFKECVKSLEGYRNEKISSSSIRSFNLCIPYSIMGRFWSVNSLWIFAARRFIQKQDEYLRPQGAKERLRGAGCTVQGHKEYLR
jgi:hypothetical protein